MVVSVRKRLIFLFCDVIRGQKRNAENDFYNEDVRKIMVSTKEKIYEYLEEKTVVFDLEHLEDFTTNEIAEQLCISRSIASQYLNELVDDGKIFKIKSRPVYFFSAKVLEQKYMVTLKNCDFLDVEDMLEYFSMNGLADNVFDSLVGFDGSLHRLIEQSTEIFDYPPFGLPLVIYGEEGTGRKTLADLICRNSLIHNGVVGKDTVYLREEIREDDEFCYRFDNWISQHVHENVVVILSKMEKISETFEKYLIDIFETKKQNNLHFIFISDQRPGLFISSRLSKNIPLAVHLHSFDERPKEEREGIVMNLFGREERSVGAAFQISSNVLRTLSSRKFPDNIQGLSGIIKMICARARLNSKDSSFIKIHTYDMPAEILENMQISSDDVTYLSCDRYIPGKEVDVYVDFYNTVLGLFSSNATPAELFSNYKMIYSAVEEHLMMKDSGERFPQGMEMAVCNIINTVIQKRFMSVPSSFSRVISKILFICHTYQPRFLKWEKDNRTAVAGAVEKIQRNFVSDTIIIDEMKALIEGSLEMEFPDMVRIIACLSLHRFNHDLSSRKVFGMILCHGYSTASSIASAANTLIGDYVFDAIDMPLNTTAEEIRQTLQERLRRINRFADVVVMVDMGSLEEIASETVLMSSRNVALINNVSTKMALSIGYKIENGDPIEMIFHDADQDFKVEHKFIHGRKSDTILFISESGMQTAQRMADLFRDSLTEEIPVNLQIGQFEKISSGGITDLMESANLLFTIGTEDPGVDGITFIPLEDLITTGCLDIISQKLSGYMSMEKVEQMIVNIRRNFTLINVVNYLTILNPQPLLDYTTVAVDNLQKRMGIELEGRRLIGIYIHLCVLVERLVTKSGVIKNDGATEEFVSTHAAFVKDVHESFKNIREYYRISIPDSEMKYIYSFMTADNEWR